MNLSNLIEASERPLSIKKVLHGKAVASLIQFNKDSILNKHQSNTDALLILLKGEAIYQEENRKVALTKTNDFVNIPQRVMHELQGKQGSQLLLIQ